MPTQLGGGAAPPQIPDEEDAKCRRGWSRPHGRSCGEILADGGNAFDAAIAGVCMSFVAEAVFASPGGGGFLMARDAGRRRAKLFDFRGDAAQAAAPRPTSRSSRSVPISEPRPKSSISASVPARRRAWRKACSPCTKPTRASHETSRRTGRARGQAGLSPHALPGLSLHRDRADPEGEPRVRAIFAPGGELLKGRDVPERRPCRNSRMASRDGARLFTDGDIGQAIAAQSVTGAVI